MAYSSGSNPLVKLAFSWGVAAVLGVLVVANRDDIHAFLAANGLTFASAAAEQGLPPVRAAETSRSGDGGGVRIRANAGGHFETRADINGRTIDVMVDTGATVVALTYDDARAAGVHVGPADFKHQVNTANGVARVASVTLDRVSIGDIAVRDVRAVVAEPGKLTVTLLGMSFLSKLSKAEMSRGVLLLQE